MIRPFAAATAALALAACATPTVYQPADPASRSAVGFSEYRIEPNRYRVTFQGGGGAPANQIADYALLRAAEIALRDGYDWFRVVDRHTDRSGSDSGPRVSLGAGSASYGRSSAVGVGVGTGFGLGGGLAWSQTIEIMLGRGERPTGVDVYDARSVAQTLGPPR